MCDKLPFIHSSLALSLIAGLTAAPAFGGICAGDSAVATNIGPNESVLLNPSGVLNDDRLLGSIIEFTNGADSEPATIEVCVVPANAHPGALGYLAHDVTLSVEVTFEDEIPNNEDTYFMRISMPFSAADIPPEAELEDEATELTTFNVLANDNAWVLAPSENTVNSPDFAESVGDRFTDMTPPSTGVLFSDDIGDHGAYWDPATQEGFVWANVDHANDFAPGSPLCWSDINDNGTVDVADLSMLLGGWGPCIDPDPPVGCTGDIFFDGVVDIRDVATLVAFWQETCFLPPETAFILHTMETVDNSAGDDEWGAGAGGNTHLTWDLRVETAPDTPDNNAWTTTELHAVIDDPVYQALTFYQHPDEQPLAAPPLNALPDPFPNCDNRPGLPFDSYVIQATGSEACDVNTGAPLPGATGLADFTQTGTELVATWFYQGSFAFPGPVDQPATIARFTVLVDREDADCPECHLDLRLIPSGAPNLDPVFATIEGVSTHRFGLSNLIPFSFDLVDFRAADIDNDGGVCVVDLLELLGEWTTGGYGTPSDINRDGVVDVRDLLMLLSRWETCVPET